MDIIPERAAIPEPFDPVIDADWTSCWRGLVAGRDQSAGARDSRYWESRASRYDLSLSGRHEPVLDILAPWLTPATTVLDVGAGTGRYAVALAGLVRQVVAVEPSPGMRSAIPLLPNLTVIGQEWPLAQLPAADVVICVNMLYPVSEIAPFLAALDQAANERVFVFMRDTPSPHPAELAAGGAREPLLRHCFLVLRQLGILPDVAMYEYQSTYRFADLTAAVSDCRQRAGPRWDDGAGRRFLMDRLAPARDGSLEFDGGEVAAGALHWRPGRR